MRAIALVAGAVFRESVRDRVPYSMVIFAALLMAASYLISQLTAGQDLKIIKDLGLAAIAVVRTADRGVHRHRPGLERSERKSVYGLLTKPVTRPQFILGEVRRARADPRRQHRGDDDGVFRCAVLHGRRGLRIGARGVAGAGRRPAAAGCDPADLRGADGGHRPGAVLLDLLEPAIGHAADAWPVGAGHFNADLRNFENVVDVPAVVWIARTLYYVLPNLAPFDVKAEVVHGFPVAMRHVALTLLYAAVYVAHAADGRGSHFPPPRLQVTSTRIVPANFRLYAAIAALMAVSLFVQVVRDRGWQPFSLPSGVLWVRSGPLAERLALGFDNLIADIYWIRAVVYFGGQRQGTQQKQFDQLFPLLDLVTSLDPHFKIAYRFGSIFLAEPSPGGAGPAGSRDAAAGKRHRRRSEALGVRARHRLHLLLVDARLHARGRVVQTVRLTFPVRRMARAGRRHDARRRRQPPIVAHAVDAASRYNRIRVDSH